MKPLISHFYRFGLACILLVQSLTSVGLHLEVGQSAPVVRATVDERVELMSIVARLAEYDEYSSNDFQSYVSDVNRHFDKYRNHPVVEYAKKVRRDGGVSYDAVMSMAVHLNPPPSLTPRIPFTTLVPDRRWGKENSEKFSMLLQHFYKDADCATFFNAHAGLYRTAEERFQQLLTKVDLGWYKRFYGELPQGDFHLLIGLLNGGGNFGPKVVFADGKEDLYAIIGTWQIDSDSLPVYDDRLLSTIIHEYNHSFINPQVYANEQQLKDAGEKVYAPVAGEMKRLAYGTWQTMMLESLVRAAVVRYTIEHENDEQKQRDMIFAERNIGFIWIEDLVKNLGEFEKSRDAYPTFRSYFPEIVKYYNALAPQIDARVKSYNAQRPSVASTEPILNGAQDVDPDITQLTFTFDRPLEPKRVSINFGPGGPAQYPIVKVVGYADEGKTFTVQLKMKPASTYEFILTEKGFRTREGFPLRPYTMKFRTR